MSFIDSRFGSFPISSYAQPTDLSSAVLFNNLFSGVYTAALAQLGQMGSYGAPDLSGYTGGASYPTECFGRGLPQVLGAGEASLPWMPPSGSSFAGNGGIDIGALLRSQLFAACPCEATPDHRSAAADSSSVAPDSTSAAPSTPTPSTSTPTPSTSEVPSTDSSCPAPAAKKAFIVGDLVHFGRGNGTVRSGLQALLNPVTGKKDGKNSHTHSKISAEDAAKIQALLRSDDPAVKALLAKKVPDKKSLVISEDGKLLGALDTKKDVMGNSSLNVGGHKNGHLDRSAGGQVKIGDQSWDVGGTELHSPIKIALDGKDAQLDSKHGFQIDLNGFQEKGGVAKTSGGLNQNEAWLVRDRDHNGIVKNGVVDGNDVYGDHNGKRKDGYDDLAKDFATEIKTDPATGKRYLDLTDPTSRAGAELKLLDAQGNLRPAKEVLKRIDLDEVASNERDAAGNVITARGAVTYQDGHRAQSADQWFRTA
ncbi:MAG: hypothetical protein U1E65_01595 [Myxococcota bacterium]